MKRKHFIKTVYLLFFISISAPFAIFGQVYPYKFNHLTVEQGLSHTDANDIAQDKEGFIWVATYFGLTRFDGNSVKNYYNENTPINNAFKNRITTIYPDLDGNIWLGTEDGIQCFNTKSEKYIDFIPSDKKEIPGFSRLIKPIGNKIYCISRNQVIVYSINGNRIAPQKLNVPHDLELTDIAIPESGLVYLASNKGVWKLNKQGVLKNLPISGLTDLQLSRLHFDNRGNLLLSSMNKLFLIPNAKNPNSNLQVSKQFIVSNNGYIRNISSGSKSEYWINTTTDLIRLDQDLNRIQVINSKDVRFNLNSNSLTKVFIDRSECLWVCTFGGGVNYCDLNQKLFYTLQHNPKVSNSLSGDHIRSVLEDGNDLWIGTMDNGLNLFNFNTQKFRFFNTSSSPVRLKNDIITSLTFDNSHNLWIGSAEGIDVLKSDRTGLLTPKGYENFPKYIIETLTKDYYGNIWFGNHTNKFGVIWKDKFNAYHVKYYDEGYFIYADPTKPQLMVSSTHGLNRIIIDHEGNILNSISYKASEKPNSLSSNYTYPISKQNDSTYWVGTIGGGLNRLIINPINSNYRIKSYTGSSGIFNDVESLEIDDAGNIWMGGNGLECFNPGTEKLVKYDKNDGLQGNSFKVGSSNKGASGRLYFGGINGLNYFNPNEIHTNKIEARPVITDILINNKKTNYGNINSSILTINYLQNNFALYFSAMHFANPLKCQYRYKLIGSDKKWIYTNGKAPFATYSNLDYKHYRFVVEASNNDGIWSRLKAETEIIITPPWWKSTLAKIVYGLLILLGLSSVYIFQARWFLLKREIEIREINEKKKEDMHKQREELSEQQLMFFTNISHEFRTPLTLIIGPLEELINQNKNIILDNSYQLMQRNSKRLINLISELMNFKKLTDSKIKLKVQPLDIAKFCDELVMEFQNLASSMNINFKFNNRMENIDGIRQIGLFDVQVLEKILLNLLNNSFKYTATGGNVSFEIFSDIDIFKPSFETGFQMLNETHRAERYLYFRIADSGIGISPDTIHRIFDRYFRVSNDHLGSGIGLALVKSLTQLHKGDIYVFSERHKGTEIIIGIPSGDENYNELDMKKAENSPEVELERIDDLDLLPSFQQSGEQQIQATKFSKCILIVDDNPELRNFLKQVLSSSYNIYEAADGETALEIATNKVPDLIISDVMMPGMSGIDLCKLVKERFETSHIPFIILSAKDALITKLAGMESGADFYFAKPLSIELLRLTVQNIFEQSEKLKLKYTNNYLADASELVQSDKDKEFINKLLNLIDNNIQDPDLDVDFLCNNLYVSRTKLYQKIKSISNQSVADFIRTIRLKKAIEIMTHEDITMNEVAGRIGLQSSSNFSRAFKKEYGKSPMQFMQSLRKSNPLKFIPE